MFVRRRRSAPVVLAAGLALLALGWAVISWCRARRADPAGSVNTVEEEDARARAWMLGELVVDLQRWWVAWWRRRG